LSKSALLALADGTLFHGQSIGVSGTTSGEVIFNTSMTGYQEILTDPSYAEQIITFTYPHIGNVGVNGLDVESDRIWSAGIVIAELSPIASNWRSEQSLPDYLKAHNVIAIAGIDTRKLTRIIRDKGAQRAAIMAGDSINLEQAIAEANSFPGLEGMDLAKHVTTTNPFQWEKGTQYPKQDPKKQSSNTNSVDLKHHVVVYDFGVKQNILRLLVDRGCRLTVVPAQTPINELLALNPDGIFLSNGPGDPAACEYAIENIKILLKKNIPMFGICLGFQLLALASGARTIKMKFGHHGANHPVRCEQTKRVLITSQNHGFAVDENSLPEKLRVTHRSLFDGTLQGVEHISKPVFGFQGHPEASPGPHDLRELFDKFVAQLPQ